MLNETNIELYRLVIADAPYVIAAYSVLWIALIVYITMVLRRMMRLEKEMAVLEETATRRGGSAA
jgi:CcmD family protein